MRKCPLFILILALLLPGCGRTKETPQYALNPDGTVGSLRWGMTFAQAVQAEKGVADRLPGAGLGFQPTERSMLRVRLPEGGNPGAPVVVELRFHRIPQERNGTPPLRLTEIRVLVVTVTENAGPVEWVGAIKNGPVPGKGAGPHVRRNTQPLKPMLSIWILNFFFRPSTVSLVRRDGS